MILPDSIEPYIGYKALNISKNGILHSPSYQVAWPVGQRLEANCPSPYIHWTPVPAPVTGIPEPLADGDEFVELLDTAACYPPPPYGEPPIELPWGWAWATMPLVHVPADEWCSCGIYAVKEKQAAFGYLGPRGLIVQVALWGQVTIGAHGARGQYAYPVKMWAPKEHFGIAHEVAERYGIPVEPQTFETGRGTHLPRTPTQKELDARQTAVFFSLCASLIAAINVARIPFGPKGPAWVTIILTVVALLFVLASLLATHDANKARKNG